MPIFEYQCQACRHQFEALVLRNEAPEACPECGKAAIERQISLCGFSSETTREANLAAGHRIADVERKDRAHAHNEHLRSHFGE